MGKRRNLEKALIDFEKAQQLLKIDFEQAVGDFIAAPNQMLRLLNNKAEILTTLYDKNKQQSTLETAFNHYGYAIKIIESLKKQYQEEVSQQLLGQLAYRSFEGAIKICHQLFKLTNKSSYLGAAFKFSEQSRSSILLEALNADRAIKFANIPDSLIANEQSIQNKITFFEKKKQEALKSDTQNNAQQIDNYNTEIFDLKNKHEALIKQFETAYPAYHNLKYNQEIILIEKVQAQLLDDSTTLLEYFVADSMVYIFAINKRDVTFKRVPFFDLLATMKMLRSGLYLPLSDSEQKHKLSTKIYQHTAYYLYQKLIQPVSDILTSKLIIINGGLLNFVPFEALLSELPNPSHRLKSYHYLLKKHEFSYAYSATLLQEVQSRQSSQNNGQLLAFAPNFSENDYRKLAPLNHNITEVKNIQKLLYGKAYTDKQASVQNFLEKANQYQLIHLATHAKANTESGDYSYLAFAANENHEDLLYTKDVYNLSLNADMVVLSACQTAQGALLKGEGMVSLGNAFFYAGAKSIINTLWSIDDFTTKELLSLFYKNIKAGQSKSAALRLAKLEFLKNTSKPHPYYWAAFVANGDMRPILKPAKNYFIWGLVLAGLIISFLGYWMIKK